MKITLKKNYHLKLEADIYLAILPFSVEHIVGLEVDVFVATKFHHKATIIHLEPVTLAELNQRRYLSLLDVSISPEEYIHAVTDHLPTVDQNDAFLELIVFKKQPSKTNEKIAIFCRQYEKFSGIKYKISKSEIGMLARHEMTEELVQKFFMCTEFWAKVKSVSYYCKNLNEIKRLTAQNSTSMHPNHWDSAYAAKLTGPQTSDYYKHLRNQDLTPKKNPLGQIINWVPAQKTPQS